MLCLVRRIQPTNFIYPNALRRSRYRRFSSGSTSKDHDPLNILFCGADEFSIYSLRALRQLQDSRPEKIAGIEVICRPDKYVGRGLKQVHEVPIKSVANELGLQLRQIDTFRNWSPPESINLIVAVSFGLLIPARILDEAKYGGLNVHPSMLPDLRGPAPIIHTLLKQRSHTGVTLQTMHPTKFDHGQILAQTSAPGFPVPEECTPDQLMKVVGPLGAQMLCQGIEAGAFVPPLDNARAGMSEAATLDSAPKITSEDRHIDWDTWTADKIILRDRVLGKLWDNETYKRSSALPSKRVTFLGPWTNASRSEIESVRKRTTSPGQPLLATSERSKDARIGIRTCEDQIVMPTGATIDGGKKGTGLAAMIKFLTSS